MKTKKTSKKTRPQDETPAHKLAGLIAVLLEPAMAGGMPKRAAKDIFDGFKFGYAGLGTGPDADLDEVCQMILDEVKEYLSKVDPNEGTLVTCPKCGKKTTVYHLAWTALKCGACGKDSKIEKWGL